MTRRDLGRPAGMARSEQRAGRYQAGHAGVFWQTQPGKPPGQGLGADRDRRRAVGGCPVAGGLVAAGLVGARLVAAGVGTAGVGTAGVGTAGVGTDRLVAGVGTDRGEIGAE